MLEDAIQRAPEIVPAKGTPGKVHILHALIHGKVFDGQIETQAKTYQFSFVPTSASIVEHRLVLRGRFVLSSPTRRAEGADLIFVDNVEAKLVATQGGVGAAPTRRQSRPATAPVTEAAAPEQKLEQDQGPETELQPGLHAFASPKYDASGRPVVDSTGPLSFVGVLYFVLSPLDSSTLKVLDLSRVQLGGRLAPTDDLGRELQLVFSDLVAALHGERPNEQAANEMVAGLNRIFRP